MWMNDLYGHFCDKVTGLLVNELKERSPVYAQFHCLFGLTVKFALIRDIHQDYKEF